MKSDGETSQLDFDSGLSVDGKKKARAYKVIRTSKLGPDTMGEIGFAHNTILDSGTALTVLGSPAWSIWRQYDQSLSMMAIDDTMNNVHK
eukprot:2819487-Ditylum_brightwellii.AAC.1